MPICSKCGSDKTAINSKTGKEMWYGTDQNPICQSCSVRGRKHTEEWKRQSAIRSTGRRHTEESKKKIGDANRGPNGPHNGKPSWNKNQTLTEEHKAHLRGPRPHVVVWNKGKKAKPETVARIIANRARQKLPFKDTIAEKIVREILQALGVEFKEQKLIPIDKKQHPCDFYIPISNLVIEADGDWYHANPNPYKRYGKIRNGFKAEDYIVGGKTAYDIWEEDRKLTDGMKAQGYKVLRLWQSELEYNLPVCIMKIKEAMA